MRLVRTIISGKPFLNLVARMGGLHSCCLTYTPSTRYSSQLHDQKIPREAADNAMTLAGSDFLELVEKS